MINNTLHEFLSCSVFSTEPVFELSKQKLTAAGRSFEMTAGGNLISWGSRADAVVIVAHADTVWNVKSDFVDINAPTQLRVNKNVVTRGRGSKTGIGADDRAGIALAFEILDLEHTILITTDEEVGMVGARRLRGQALDVFDRLQEHRFFLQLDRQGHLDFKCYDVGTDAFRAYVGQATGLTEPNRSSFTDIVTLCRNIPGVNISVGYNYEHTPNEMLDVAHWDKALSIVRSWLVQPIPEFKLETPHFGCASFPPISKLDETSRAGFGL